MPRTPPSSAAVRSAEKPLAGAEGAAALRGSPRSGAPRPPKAGRPSIPAAAPDGADEVVSFSERARRIIGSSGNSPQEARRDRRLPLASKLADPAVAQIEPPFGPRDPDEEQATLFFQLAIVVPDPGVGKNPLFQPDEKDHGELEAFGRVQGHQGDRSPRPSSDRRQTARLISSMKSMIEAPGCSRSNSRAAETSFIDAGAVAPRHSSWSLRQDTRDTPSAPGAYGVTSSAVLVTQGREPIHQHSEIAETLGRPCPSNRGPPKPAGPSPAGEVWPPSPGPQDGRARSCRGARRHVDNPTERHVVLRIDEQVQVGKNVLDLEPFVERNSSDDLVAESSPRETLIFKVAWRAVTRQKTAISPNV